jgi:putative ABC transport system permease protein
MRAIRDIFRRKLRSSLTIFGISIGVFTLVVLGAFAEKANVTVDSGSQYYETRVIVAEAKDVNTFGMPSGNRPLSMKKIDEIRDVRGVKDVAPQISTLLEANPQVTGGSPSLLLGGYMGTMKCPEEWRFSKGRGFSETERGVAVVGTDLVKQLQAEIGGPINVRGVEFTVVGILDRSFTIFNQSVMIPLADARQLYVDSLPQAVRKSVDKDDLATNFLVYTSAGKGSDDVAKRINREVKGVKASGVTEIKKAVSQLLGIIGAIMFGVGSIALLIGGLSVVNTMTMSVSERTREIGIKRAMGASTGRIIREVLTEAAAMSGVGGLLGMGGGMLGVVAINAVTSGSGTVLFMVTARLVVRAAIFAVALGVLAGFYPAWRAARMNPTAALGYE